MVPIEGIVSGADDLENIHVINKTSKTFTITSQTGHFKILVKLNDTLVFSSIQYADQSIIIDASVIANKAIIVNLEAFVNTLDEVVVGKILTGNLMLDVGNSTAETEINFYDVGIPGYTGRRKTQTERRLQEATTGGGVVGLNPIINGLSGRTKMLKNHVKLERNDALINEIRQRLSADFFSEHPLEEYKHMDFWYFCSDDPYFEKRCKGKKDIVVLSFLKAKYNQYLLNSKSPSN
ncbi:hypothetical protein ACJOV8_002175 [Formosa sp. 3Alg 14/1]|uniref:hypothetical protein n=1 Tax=Formosa sp. 3Alg 14/1 TaxID=3382190 RepID=UPI0039BE0F14